MNDNKERTSVIMTVRRNNNYKAMAPRVIRGNWLNGFIKIDEKEKASQAFEFFVSEIKRGIKLELAKERTKAKFKISLTMEECGAKPFSRGKSTYEVHVG